MTRTFQGLLASALLYSKVAGGERMRTRTRRGAAGYIERAVEPQSAHNTRLVQIYVVNTSLFRR